MNSPHLDGQKKELLELIKRRGELSLEAAAESFDLAKTTLRQHLLTLERQGLIQRKYERVGQGRPKVVFELSEAGQRLYPTQEPKLFRELLEHLKANNQHDTIQDFFKTYWAKREAHFEALLATHGAKKATIETRIQALRELLESEGFMPQIEIDSKRRVTVSECNCPFREAINATQLPCKLEAEFIQKALKTKMVRTGYIPNGSNACVYLGQSK